MQRYIGLEDQDMMNICLDFLDESQIAEIIDELKLMYNLDDETINDYFRIDEAVDFAKDDLKQDFLELCKEYNLDKDTAIEALLSMLGKHAMKVLMLNLKKHFNK
jgi:hypothetical protein